MFVRTFYSAVMHATDTATVGAGLGWGRFRGIRPTVLMGSLGLTAAIGIHATWNGLLTIDPVLPDSPAWQADLTLLPLLVFGVFVVFELCVLEETRTIRRELEDEVERGVLPPTHPRILASWWRRMGHHWAPANIDKRSYIAAATSLALRKH